MDPKKQAKLKSFTYTPPSRDEHPFNIAVGLFRGHQVTKRDTRRKRGQRMTIKRKKSRFAKEIVTEITGFAPYEKRTMELLRVQRDKRALKFLKKRLGTHHRGKQKREQLSTVLRSMKKAQSAK